MYRCLLICADANARSSAPLPMPAHRLEIMPTELALYCIKQALRTWSMTMTYVSLLCLACSMHVYVNWTQLAKPRCTCADSCMVDKTAATLPGSANQCVLRNVYLGSHLLGKAMCPAMRMIACQPWVSAVHVILISI